MLLLCRRGIKAFKLPRELLLTQKSQSAPEAAARTGPKQSRIYLSFRGGPASPADQVSANHGTSLHRTSHVREKSIARKIFEHSLEDAITTIGCSVATII